MIKRILFVLMLSAAGAMADDWFTLTFSGSGHDGHWWSTNGVTTNMTFKAAEIVAGMSVDDDYYSYFTNTGTFTAASSTNVWEPVHYTRLTAFFPN